MLYLSDVLIQGKDLETFDELTAELKKRAAAGELSFQMDVKPPCPETPDDWEDRLEAAFTSRVG